MLGAKPVSQISASKKISGLEVRPDTPPPPPISASIQETYERMRIMDKMDQEQKRRDYDTQVKTLQQQLQNQRDAAAQQQALSQQYNQLGSLGGGGGGSLAPQGWPQGGGGAGGGGIRGQLSQVAYKQAMASSGFGIPQMRASGITLSEMDFDEEEQEHNANQKKLLKPSLKKYLKASLTNGNT